MDFCKLAAFTHGTVINVKGLDKEFVKTVKKSGLNTSGREGPTRGFEKKMRPFYQGAYNSGTGKIKLPADYDYDDAKPYQGIEAGVPYGPEVKIDYTSDNGARKRVYSFRRGDDVKNVNGRKFLADWVTSPENPMFTKTIVNRLWDRMMGVPLVGNLTDMKESHLGVNPQLTEFLISTMKKIKYDQKQFMRIIAKTQIYQRDSSQNVTGKYYFTGPVKKRISAEQVWDSLLSLRTENPDRSAVVSEFSRVNLIYDAIGKMTLEEKVAHGKNTKPLTAKINMQLTGNEKAKKERKKTARASEWFSPAPMGTTLQAFGQSRRQIIDGANTDATIPQALSLLNEEFLNTIQKNLTSAAF